MNSPGHLHIYIFQWKIISSDQSVVNVSWSLVIICCWWLVEPPHLKLVHYGKWEIQCKIANMEFEYSDLMTWSPHEVPPSDASSQWGHNIKVVGLPQRESETKKKSLLVEMFGFALDGELNNVANYLRSHGGFKLEQVRPKATCVQYFMVK